MKIRDILAVHSFLTSTVTACPFRGLLLDLDILIYLNTWHLGVPKFSFKRVRVLEIHPTQPRGGHPSHSNLVRGKLTSPTPNPAGDGTSGLTSYPRRRSKVSEATCLRPQRSAHPGLEPGPSNPESSALTTGPLTPHLKEHTFTSR